RHTRLQGDWSSDVCSSDLLRERREDIPSLIEHFTRQVCDQNNWKPIPFAPEAIRSLQAHGWPGNVRELRNVVERLLLLAVDGGRSEERRVGAGGRSGVWGW